MKAIFFHTAEENIQWSPSKWNLEYFPENLQIRLRQLEPNRPLLTQQINGDEVYVRRVGTKRFQCGVFVVCASSR